MTISDSEDDVQERPFKKRKLLVHIVEDSPPKKTAFVSAAASAPRKPLLLVKNPAIPKPHADAASDGLEGYYLVLWSVKWTWLRGNTNCPPT